jgi:hypothetical protein
MQKTIIILFLSLLITGCEKSNKVSPKPSMNEEIIRELTIKAINGNRTYNDSLSGLIDYSLPLNSKFNNLKIARTVTPINKTFFEILLEYPNPIYNRFAVYDSALHLILVDKSLNGKLGLNSFNINNQQFIEIDETFISKDIIELSRVSLYNADSTVTPGFRLFTKCFMPTNEYYQVITEISRDRIKTKLTSLKRSLISDKTDILTPDNQNKLNSGGIFGNYIEKQISGFKHVSEKPAITDEISVLQSLGITKGTDSIKSSSVITSVSGYYLTIDEGWKEMREVSLYGYANKIKGDRFYNPLMGTNLFIAQIPEKDSAEVYIDTKLSNITQGKYKVRFTGKIEKGKFYIQYFEFSCNKRKFLMIFEASKFTYEKYKIIYQDIINSFVIEC